MADIRKYEPYSLANMIKANIERHVKKQKADWKWCEAEQLGCEEVEPFIRFLVDLYFDSKEGKK